MFDARRFLHDNFQNVGGVVAHLRAAGLEAPTEQQAEKWFQRGSLPGAWLANLLVGLEINKGGAISVRPYCEGAK